MAGEDREDSGARGRVKVGIHTRSTREADLISRTVRYTIDCSATRTNT